VSTCLPSRKNRMLGIDRTLNRTVVRWLLSTSSLATLTLPAYSLASSSMTGATIRHGPHHAAQKSTIARPFASSISVPKFASVTSTGFPFSDISISLFPPPWLDGGPRVIFPTVCRDCNKPTPGHPRASPRRSARREHAHARTPARPRRNRRPLHRRGASDLPTHHRRGRFPDRARRRPGRRGRVRRQRRRTPRADRADHARVHGRPVPRAPRPRPPSPRLRRRGSR